MIIHFIGLGGSGKTTVAKILAKKMIIPFFDLDEYFIENIGNISQFIDRYGYEAYTKRNIEFYIQLKQKIEHNKVILVCSSGFMTYSRNIIPEYLAIIHEIENHPFTFLLIPAFNFNECSEIIMTRQLSRLYLNTTAEKEQVKLQKRFDIYNKLNSNKVLTNTGLNEIVKNIMLTILSKYEVDSIKTQK